MPPYHHEENKAEALLRRELSRRGLEYRQSEMIAGREIDFFLPRCLLAVEIDGFSHYALSARLRDLAKEKSLAELGISLLRLGNEEVLADVRACGQKVADYARDWEKNVNRRVPGAEEAAWQKDLRLWAARAGIPVSEPSRKPGRGGRG